MNRIEKGSTLKIESDTFDFRGIILAAMVERHALLKHVRSALRRGRVIALVGPRQCGKTTLARELLQGDSPNYFDLEDPIESGAAR